MKTTFSTISSKAFVMLLFVLPALTSCDKCKDDIKPTAKEQLVGEWKIKSFTIDGVEVKGTIVSASKMEFEAYTGNNGDFEWSINYADGTSEIQSGDYTVDEADKEIDFENAQGEHEKFDFELDGDKLELSGISDGDRVILKADRD